VRFVSNRQLFEEGWDKLPQARFWQQVMDLPHDSLLINEAATRRILQRIAGEEWHCQLESEKEDYRACMRRLHALEESAALFVTSGKREFYEFKKVIPLISKSIDVFMNEGVDPWYAQTILLIESPGKSTQKSSAGAYGPFQLMRSVALKFGLKVNRYTDERADLYKSARASAALLGTICIPKTRALLDSLGIAYDESDLWFRLLVMHAYHAGAGNVRCMLEMLQPPAGGIGLFRQLWSNECRGFRNESQNYSQIALAAIVLFDRIVSESADTAFLVSGDRLYAQFPRAGLTPEQSTAWLRNCLEAYENDLVDGVIPFEYFYSRVNALNRELAFARLKDPAQPESADGTAYPASSDRFVKIGDQLLRKKKIDEAIKVYKFNIERHPASPLAYDSLGRAYRLLGKNELALKYINKSQELKGAGPGLH
jgi:tetratricopeptide (TPR) repeat protein